MASLAPTPPLPGALPYSSPTSVPAHGPTATLPVKPLQPSSSLATQVGRSKGERWRDASPSSSAGGSSPVPSFKEVLLSGGASSSALPQPVVAKVRRPPRIVLRSRAPQTSAGEGPDGAGWHRYEGRHARKRRLRGLREPRRSVPADLRGRCFNCLSPSHRAASYLKGPRCFRCRAIGHRASVCGGRGQALHAVAPRALLVWRPKSTLGDSKSVKMVSSTAAPDDGGSGAAGAAAVPGTRTRRHRRVRKRGRSKAAGSGGPSGQEDEENNVSAACDHAPTVSGDAPARPRRVIDHSAKMSRAEDELRNALSVSIVGDTATLSVDVLVDELARRHELPIESLEFHSLSREDGLLILPDEASAVRVYNEGRPLHLPLFTLFFRRWFRFKGASAVVLPSLVDIELRGIPAHAWELETAEHLLDEWGWVRELHPATIDRKDYSVFRLKAWCSQPELIPTTLDLDIVEPPIQVEDFPPVKRALRYEIKIAVSASTSFGMEDDPPSPPLHDDSDQGRRRRRRQAPASPESVALGSGASGDQGAEVEDPIDGANSAAPEATQAAASQPVEPEATRVPSLSPASSLPVAIDDPAALVILPGLANEDLIPQTPGFPFWLSEAGPASSVRLDENLSNDTWWAKDGTTAQSPGDRPAGPLLSGPHSSRGPDQPGLTSHVISGAGLLASPSLDEAPTQAPGGHFSCEDLFQKAATYGGGDGVAAAPLPEPLLASVEALAGPAGVDVLAVTPHRTSALGPGCVEVMAETPPAATRRSPSGKAILESPSRRRSRFMKKISKRIEKILPTPRAPKPRARSHTSAAPPRRSRRIAGVGPESPSGAVPTRYRKRVMTVLNVVNENDGIHQDVLDAYGKLFGQPLPESHVQALAALFGWATPDVGEVETIPDSGEAVLPVVI
ncbi:unnamed protein product [Miscanthus lutarioriparius]|uniref:DUF4283 domain-containing protein n=1 Tax=Miscanthus lutarioriparius TaxID=422564 RepID=A0A811MFJ0_9POAL|nr:unnamed protein product [Miscanthus lutarioriparius]